MWEFGTIARNLLNGNGYLYTAITKNVPSAYMPPGLPFIYYVFFLLFGDNWIGCTGILALNIIISSIGTFTLYKISEYIYGFSVAVLTALYASFSPVYIFSSVTYNSIVYFHLFIALCFLYFLKTYYQYPAHNSIKTHTYTFKNVFILSICMSLFLYFRAEMLFLVLAIPILFLMKKKIKYALILFFVPLLVISPWTVRNYMVFGKLVPVTTSSGYNFYTGHGDDATTIEYNIILNTFKEDSTFEINKSNLSYEIAFEYIKEKPLEDFFESLKRVIDLWVFDRYRESAKHPVYLITWLLTLTFFILGYYWSIKDKNKSAKLYFMKLMIIFSTLLVMLFFSIPRYQIQISFIMIPAAMYGLNVLFNKIKIFYYK